MASSICGTLVVGHPLTPLHFNSTRPRACVWIQFDDVLTRKVFGFDSVDAYYEAASSDKFLPAIAVPFLAINAMDDPIRFGCFFGGGVGRGDFLMRLRVRLIAILLWWVTGGGCRLPFGCAL